MSDGKLSGRVRAEQEPPNQTADNEEPPNRAPDEPSQPPVEQERVEPVADGFAKGDRSGPEAARLQGHWLLA